MKDSKENAERKQEKRRGTSDDVEVLLIIINQNLGVKKKVLDKIRMVRAEKERREAEQSKKAKKEPA